MLNGCVVAILMHKCNVVYVESLSKVCGISKLLKKINIKPGLFCDVKMQIDARLNYSVTKEEDKSKKRRKILRR